MTFRATGFALLITGFLGLTGCTSLSSLWPFHKPAPLAQVSTTESKLNDLTKQIAAVQQTQVLDESRRENASRDQWRFVSRFAYGLGSAEASSSWGAVRALTIPLAQISSLQSPLTADDRAAVDSLVHGLESAAAADRQAAQDLLDQATTSATSAHTQQLAAESKVIAATATLGTLQTQDATLRTQLTSQTKAAVEADNVKNQALATWNSLKLWFFIILALLVIGFVLSHLHLTSIAKTLVK